MKRFLALTFAVAWILSGCNRATPTPAADHQNDAPPTGAGASPAGSSAVAFKPETRSLISSGEVPLLEQIDRENVKVVAAALPGIVRITATMSVDPRLRLFGNALPFQFHFGPGGHRLFAPNEPAFGSGVIISKDGYIVTNYHVVEEARDVSVQLQDQRILPARVVASDAPTDVTVLKIDATDLSALPWGDSDKVEVGQQVFAIGNPFNLENSVSKGIVSAMGRNLEGADGYEDYIQMDAAINPGNSGGALVNIHGELIGINSAIASMSHSSSGVGFAIPSNLVRYAVEGLLKDGKLVRGYLGVTLPTSMDEGVTTQLGLETDRGALLAGVQAGSPAQQAQLRPVDFITEVDGHRIDSVAHLRLIVAQIPVGKKVVVKYIRGGVSRSAYVTISEVPNGLEQEALPEMVNEFPPAPSDGLGPHLDNVLADIQVTDLNDKTRREFGVADMVTSGVVITDVTEGSVADAKVLRGDVIEVACAHRASIEPLPSAVDFKKLAENLKADQGVVLLVHHGASSRFIYLTPQ